MITVKTRKEKKAAQEAFKSRIDSVQELKKELLKQLLESKLWHDLSKEVSDEGALEAKPRAELSEIVS